MPMESGLERKQSSLWRGWVLPILFVLGVAAAVGYGVSRQYEVSFPLAIGVVFVALAVAVAALTGLDALYGSAARRLGWRCEVRPQAHPKSARSDVDIVVQGESYGRPFTLYRERSRDTSRNVTTSSGLEWPNGEARLPEFSLQVSPLFDVTADRVVGAGALVKTLAASLGMRAAKPRVEFEPASRLARRSELRASNGAAAGAFFTPTVCDALDPLLSRGSIESRDGMLVIRQPGFPLPWALDEFVRHAEEIRRALAG